MNKEFIFILWAKWHVANFDMPMWCRFGWHISSSNLINLMTLIWNLPLNFDVAFCNWLDKFLPPTMTLRRPSSATNWTARRQARAFVERENSQLIADTSYYQVQKVRPIIKRHVLLLGFVITIQKPTEICQVSLK